MRHHRAYHSGDPARSATPAASWADCSPRPRTPAAAATNATNKSVNFTLTKKLTTTVIWNRSWSVNQLVTSLYNQKFGVVFHYWLIISNIFIKNFLEKKNPSFQPNAMTKFCSGHSEKYKVRVYFLSYHFYIIPTPPRSLHALLYCPVHSIFYNSKHNKCTKIVTVHICIAQHHWHHIIFTKEANSESFFVPDLHDCHKNW